MISESSLRSKPLEMALIEVLQIFWCSDLAVLMDPSRAVALICERHLPFAGETFWKLSTE